MDMGRHKFRRIVKLRTSSYENGLIKHNRDYWDKIRLSKELISK